MAGATSIPIIGGLFDDSGDKAMAELAKNRALFDSIDLPSSIWKDLAPELYQNESANYELTAEDPVIRSNQMELLNKLSGLADTGLSDADAAGFQKARAEGQQIAKSGTDAALANAQARGVGGSGLEFAMREAAGQSGAERAQAAGLDQAATAANQRALYNQAYGAQLGNVRSQDLNANKANTDIINQFNMANTQQRNQTSQANTALKNQNAQYNQQGAQNLAQQNFNNQITRAGGQAQANTAIANGYYAQNAANTADRNMWTQIGAQAGLAAMGAPSAPKKAGG